MGVLTPVIHAAAWTQVWVNIREVLHYTAGVAQGDRAYLKSMQGHRWHNHTNTV
jgi:hypothetical protein